jgi:hypothetical protein
MSVRRSVRLAGLAVGLLLTLTAAGFAASVEREQSSPAQNGAGRGHVRVIGTVRDQQSAIPLPGVAVEVIGTSEITYTDVDGRYTFDLAPGAYELKIVMDGYQERRLNVELLAERPPTVDVALPMASFNEQVTVAGRRADAESSSAEAQLVERKNAPVISDNLGAQEMRKNGDSDAAAAMQRVTGLSVVDHQFVFVRGLGERHSNTTLSGSVIPTTEPDKKVVPLDLFPTGLIDSVQIAKTGDSMRSARANSRSSSPAISPSDRGIAAIGVVSSSTAARPSTSGR